MSKKLQTPEVSQINRLAGQIQGIGKMLQTTCDLDRVLQQLEAVCGNLKSLEKKLLQKKMGSLKDKELQRCLSYLCKIR